MAITNEMQIGWQDYLAIIIRRRWFFIVPCAVILIGAMTVGLVLPKIYQAQTVLLVADPKIMNPLMSGMAVSSPVERRMSLVQEELLSWTSLSRLAHELGLDREAKTPMSFESMVKKFQRDIEVNASKNGLITLSYQHQNPELAQRVLNTVTNIYVQRTIESQTAEAETAIRFIEGEMEGYKKKLEESERALREFKELYAMEMPVAATLNSQIIGLQVQLARLLVENTEEHPMVTETRRQIRELTAKRNEEIRKVIAQAMARGASPEIYGDLMTSLEAHDAPAVQPSQTAVPPQLKAAREAYQAWVERMDGAAVVAAQPATTTPQGASATGAAPVERGAAGTGANGAAEDEGGFISITLGPRQEQELVRLRRDYQVHASAYNQMKQRLELARVTQRLGESDDGTKFKIIEPARLPLRPVSPNLWLIFCTSLGIGIFVGVCAAFAAEYLDQSFQSAEDVQASLALPVLGSISRIVTEGDLEARRRRIKGWMSVKRQAERFKTYVLQPVWSRVDQALVRWGL